MDNSKEEEKNGFGEEDDDFEFGGFEAAEPVDPNVAQNANSGAQAGPNPWASMFSTGVPGAMNVQPDLLCGQDRFPQHLDNPLTVDVASSAEASLPVPQDDTGARINGAANSSELEFDLDAEESQFNLDNVNLANDILDGSFRSNQSGASGQLPDISGLDLALGVPNIATNRNEAEDVSNNAVLAEASNSENQQMPSPVVLDPRSANVCNMDADSGEMARTNQRTEAEQNLTNQNTANAGSVDGIQELAAVSSAEVRRDSEEKENLKQALEKQLSENTKLSQDLERAHKLAEAAKVSYEKLQLDHKKQLESLRAAGHESLTVVVNEYKDLLSSTVAQQQELWQRSLIERLKQESERFRELLHLQKDEFDALQREERAQTERRLSEAVEEMRTRQQERFEQQLVEDRKESAERVAAAIQTERETSAREIQKVIEQEQNKAKDMLEKEKEAHQQQLAGQVVKNKEETERGLKEQQNKYQMELCAMLEEERRRGREAVQQCVQTTRDEMKTYLHQQTQCDRATQRRQLASLDLFLESARMQLSTLMSTDHSNTVGNNHDLFAEQGEKSTEPGHQPPS